MPVTGIMGIQVEGDEEEEEDQQRIRRLKIILDNAGISR